VTNQELVRTIDETANVERRFLSLTVRDTWLRRYVRTDWFGERVATVRTWVIEPSPPAPTRSFLRRLFG